MSRSPRCVSKSPVVEDTLNMISTVKKANQSFFWGAVNVSILAILLYDIIYTCPTYTRAVYYGELVLAVILTLNAIFHITRYVYANWWLKPVILTKKQRRLMGVDDIDPHFKNPSATPETKVGSPQEGGQQRSPSPVRHTPKTLFSSPSSSPNTSLMTTIGSSASPASFNSSAFGNSSASILSSPNYSMSSPSWIYHKSSPGMPNLTPASGSSPYSPSGSLPALTPYPSSNQYAGNPSSQGHLFSPVMANTSDLGRLNPNPRASLESSFMSDLQGQPGGLSTPINPMKASQWSPISPASSPTTFSPNGTQNQPSLLSRCAYQVSPLIAALTPGRGRSDGKKRDDSWSGMAHSSPLSSGSSSSPSTTSPGSGSVLSHGNDLWQRCGVNVACLERWTMNLRVWLSQTIVERVVQEIDAVNEALGWNNTGAAGTTEGGAEEQGIGHISLERLRSAMQVPHIVAATPNLSLLIPFLEATPNQKYLVTRLRKLAEGGCMSSFNWNGDFGLERGSAGGHQGSNVSQCPTDAFIVAHLFATYLDTQMPSLPPSAVFLSQDNLKTPTSVLTSMAVPSQASSPPAISPNTQAAYFPLPLESPESRPFSIRHFARIPEELARKKRGADEGGGHMIIYQAKQNPPHFQLVTPEEVFDVGKGRNNLFHTILLFLHQIKTKEHGMLGRVSLGKSGINLLWVIDGE